jgi:hypothetical protein
MYLGSISIALEMFSRKGKSKPETDRTGSGGLTAEEARPFGEANHPPK